MKISISWIWWCDDPYNNLLQRGYGQIKKRAFYIKFEQIIKEKRITSEFESSELLCNIYEYGDDANNGQNCSGMSNWRKNVQK